MVSVSYLILLEVLSDLRRNGEQPVDNTGTERNQQSIRVREPTRDKDVGAVVGDDVHTAELHIWSVHGEMTTTLERLTCCINMTKNALCAARRLRLTAKNSFHKDLPSRWLASTSRSFEA